MQKLKKLPFVLAILVTLFMTACTEVDVTPRTEDEDEDPILIEPTAMISAEPIDQHLFKMA